MKRFIVYCLLFIGVVFFLADCNTPDELFNPDSGTRSGSEEVVFDWGTPGTHGEPGSSEDYPGIMIALADCPTITGTLGKISLYGQVVIEASLYATKEDFEADPQEPIEQANGLGQFKILKSSVWTDQLFPQKDNMNTNGETTAVVPKISTENDAIPVNVLVQTAIDSGVEYIEIRKLTFKPRTSDVALEKIYDNGNYMDIDGNKIVFKNSTYSDSGALYRFPDSWGGTETDSSPLANRTITFAYSIPAHTCAPSGTPAVGESVEHQIHIQAAHKAEDKYNGENNATGQKYKPLVNGSGSFTLTANELIESSQASDATGGPFVLTSVRIINNGTTYEGAVRCKSYALVLESIEISPIQ